MASRRLLRGLLEFGIFAAPAHNRSVAAGHRTYARKYRWIPVCLSHKEPKILGSLTRHSEPQTCEPGHDAKSLELSQCKEPSCLRVLVYTQTQEDVECTNGKHKEKPILEGGVNDVAAKYKKPEP